MPNPYTGELYFWEKSTPSTTTTTTPAATTKTTPVLGSSIATNKAIDLSTQISNLQQASQPDLVTPSGQKISSGDPNYQAWIAQGATPVSSLLTPATTPLSVLAQATKTTSTPASTAPASTATAATTQTTTDSPIGYRDNGIPIYDDGSVEADLLLGGTVTAADREALKKQLQSDASVGWDTIKQQRALTASQKAEEEQNIAAETALEASIRAKYGEQIAQEVSRQNQETAQQKTQLARMGAMYTTSSGNLAQVDLASEHAKIISSMESERDLYLAQAKQALTAQQIATADKYFTRAQELNQQAINQRIQLQQEQREAATAALAQQKAERESRYVEMSAGSSLYDTTTGEFVTAPAKSTALIQEYELAKSQGFTGSILDYQTQKKGTAAVLDEETIQFMAEQYLTTGTLPSFGMGANGAAMKAEILTTAAQLANDAGLSGSYVGLQQASYKASKDALTQQTKQYTANKTMEGKVNNTLDLAEAIAPKVLRSGSPVANRYSQYIAGQQLSGDPNLVQFENHIYEAVTDYAKILSGSAGSVAGISDTARTEAQKLLDASMTPEQFSAAVAAMRMNMTATMKAYESTIAGLKNNISTSVDTVTTSSSSESYSEGDYSW